MRLILPSGEYPLDGVWDFSRVSLSDVIAFETYCGPRNETGERIGYATATNAVGALITALRAAFASGDTDALALAIVESPWILEPLGWLVWLARHHAGDRQPNGAPLSKADANDFPISALAFKPDPGDDVAETVEAEVEPDPTTPRRSGSGRGVQPGKPKKTKAV